MTLPLVSPEVEAKAVAMAQYSMIANQQVEYGWQAKVVDVGDYVVAFVEIKKPEGRTFVARLRFDDYPEVAPELRFIDPSCFGSPSENAPVAAEFYPTGEYVVNAGERGELPVPCLKGHRDYYAKGWHAGWANPPKHDHSPYQLVVNIRNAILDRWA